MLASTIRCSGLVGPRNRCFPALWPLHSASRGYAACTATACTPVPQRNSVAVSTRQAFGPSYTTRHSRSRLLAVAAAAAAAAAATTGSGSSSSSDTPTQEQGPGGPAAGEGPLPVRRIILLRHADSESSSSVRDHERPISSHGRREALSIAKRLRDLGWEPDLIIASNSRRTKMTLDVMAEADELLGQVDAHYLGSLYTVAALDGQTRTHLEECIRSVACDTANFCVMCVGHNKGWEEAASSFARQAVRLHTASAALLEAAGRTWQDATASEVEWRLVQVVTPP